MSIRQVIKSFAPPFLLQLRRRVLRRGIRYSRRLASWTEAQGLCSGYSSIAILERVRAATHVVVRGEAAFERDSVLFSAPSCPFEVLTALLGTALLNRGHLQVLDFGGSLGSLYHRCRPFLHGIQSLNWSVIEQAAFADVGQREFATSELMFYRSLAELPPIDHGIALACSVLQYLEDPLQVLQQLAGLPLQRLLIDRTPVSEDDKDSLTVQRVFKDIYEASYPSWIFSHKRLLAELSGDWNLLCEYDAADGSMRTDDGLSFSFRGYLLERRK